MSGYQAPPPPPPRRPPPPPLPRPGSGSHASASGSSSYGTRPYTTQSAAGNGGYAAAPSYHQQQQQPPPLATEQAKKQQQQQQYQYQQPPQYQQQQYQHGQYQQPQQQPAYQRQYQQHSAYQQQYRQQQSSYQQQPPQNAAPPDEPPVAKPFAYSYAASALQQPAASQEPYGQVIPPTGTSSSMTHRSEAKRQAAATVQYSHVGGAGSGSYGGAAPVAYGGMAGPTGATTNRFGKTGGQHQQQLDYQHNTAALVFLIPALTALFWMFESPYPLQAFLFVTLVLYAMDLANAREMISVFVWISVAIMTLVTGWFILLATPDEEDAGLNTLTLLLRISGNCFLFLCLGAWCTLQFKWLYDEAAAWAKSVERLLHAILPPAASAVISYQLSDVLVGELGEDSAAILAPFLFAFFLTAGMLILGCSKSSFVPPKANSNAKSGDDDKNNGKSHHQQEMITYAIPTRFARIHSSMLLLVPAMIHTMTFRARIMSVNVSMEEWYDLILVWAIPYLLHYIIHLLHHSGAWTGPYGLSTSFLSNLLFPVAGKTLRGTIVPLSVSLAASFAGQQRYLIPLCHQVSYQFQGHDIPSATTIMIFLTTATVFMVMGSWIWGSYSTETNEPLFGEFHEDVVQLCFAVAGMCGGKAFGMPWGLVPLPILAFLGLSLWLTTRLLRYLAVFLFVVHATGVVLFSYRFAGMENTIDLPIPGLSITLTRFGMTVVAASVLIGLLAGLSVRSSGGYAAKTLKRLDVAGGVLVLYTLLLAALECTLLTKPLPAKELAGIELDLSDVEDEEMLYDNTYAFFTSGLIIAIALFMQHYNAISSLNAAIAGSFAVGKAMAVFIEEHNEITSSEIFYGTEGTRMFFQCLSATLLFVAVLLPRSLLNPIHVRSKYYKRSHATPGKGASTIVDSLPLSARPTILLYTFVMLPACLLITVPTVIMPMVGACSSYYGGGYYEVSPPLSVILGYILAIWGLASLSMVNHYLPDGGGEAMKQLYAFTFLMAVGLIFAAPTLPDWLVEGMTSVGAGKSASDMVSSSFNNPYASVSSIGVKMIRGKNSRSGGWGLLAASSATLLAITGPLELRERKHTSGKKDTFFLFRLMVFSIFFGCGVAWFIVMQNMSEEHFLVLILTAASCMAVSFFGTVAAVLGYFLEIENIDEAVQVCYVWMAAFPLFMIISAIPQFLLKGRIHPFGTGGWLSTYLAIYSISALALSSGMKARFTKSKETRAIGNSSCVVSYVCAISVLYGRYGVAGLDADFDVATILGVPASVLGTFFLSPVLLALEGESSGGGRLKKLSAGAQKTKTRVFGGLIIKDLNDSTKLVPPLMGTVIVFLYASLYAILFRGSGLLFATTLAAKSHEDVFKTAMGATANKRLDDLAALYQKAVVNNKAMFASAQLAGAGFWTAQNMFGPILHLGGVAACLPSLFFLGRYLWAAERASATYVTLALPLNAIPLLLCRGIPTLRAAALVGVIGGLVQLLAMKAIERKSRMRI